MKKMFVIAIIQLGTVLSISAQDSKKVPPPPPPKPNKEVTKVPPPPPPPKPGKEVAAVPPPPPPTVTVVKFAPPRNAAKKSQSSKKKVKFVAPVIVKDSEKKG